MLPQQSNRPIQTQMMPRYLELIDQVADHVKFYRLSCNVEPDAARVAFEPMHNEI